MDLIDGNCAAEAEGLAFRCNGNPFNHLLSTDTRGDPIDQSVRSDVYGKGLHRPHWVRDSRVNQLEADLPPGVFGAGFGGANYDAIGRYFYAGARFAF